MRQSTAGPISDLFSMLCRSFLKRLHPSALVVRRAAAAPLQVEPLLLLLLLLLRLCAGAFAMSFFIQLIAPFQQPFCIQLISMSAVVITIAAYLLVECATAGHGVELVPCGAYLRIKGCCW